MNLNDHKSNSQSMVLEYEYGNLGLEWDSI